MPSYIPSYDDLDRMVEGDPLELRDAAVALAARCEALEQLLVKFRTGARPSESLFGRLEKTRRQVGRYRSGGEG